MYQVINIKGVNGGECAVVLSDREAVLVDTGFACCADIMLAKLEKALDGRALQYIMLTHSHYDHVGGCPTVRNRYPDAKTVASALAAQILEKPSARKVMREMEVSAAARAGLPPPPPDYFEGFSVDTALEDGDRIEFDGSTVRAIATPGHTRCCMSFLFEKDGLLAASETLGVATFFPQILPTFITSYRDTLRSIAECEKLHPSRLLASHSPLLTGADVARFWEIAPKATEELATLILERNDQNVPVEEIVQDICNKWYDDRVREIQPESAFLVNIRAMIPRLLQEFGKETVA